MPADHTQRPSRGQYLLALALAVLTCALVFWALHAVPGPQRPTLAPASSTAQTPR